MTPDESPDGEEPEDDYDEESACNICNRSICGCDEIYEAWKDSQYD